MLNKFRWLTPLPIFSQSDYLFQEVDINSHYEWQTVQIQSCWLLDLHCLQRQGISGFSRTRVKKCNISLSRGLGSMRGMYCMLNMLNNQSTDSTYGSIVSECRLGKWSWTGTWLFHLILNLLLLKKTVQTLIRRRVLWRLIWISTVWQCPKRYGPATR